MSVNPNVPQPEQHGSDFWLGKLGEKVSQDTGEDIGYVALADETPAPAAQQQAPAQQAPVQQQAQPQAQEQAPVQPAQQQPQAEAPKEITIPDPFAGEPQKPVQPVYNEQQIQRMVEQKATEIAQKKIDQLMNEYEFVDDQGNVIDNNAEKPQGEQKEYLTREDAQRFAREEVQRVQQQQNLNQQNIGMQDKYRETFLNSLKEQGVEVTPIVESAFNSRLTMMETYLKGQLGRDYLYPEETKEIISFHRNEMQTMLNQKPQVQQAGQAISPINQQQVQGQVPAQTVIPNQPVNIQTVDDINKEIARLEQAQGELLPSQASALQTKYMQITGKNKMRFTS